MLYLLIGEDSFSINEALSEIKRGLGDPGLAPVSGTGQALSAAEGLLATNTTVLDGQQATPEQLKAVCQTVPFLAPKRLVIVQGLLARFETRDRPRPAKAPSSDSKDDVKAFADAMSQVPESTVLVVIDPSDIGRIKARDAREIGNPLFKEVNAKANVRIFPLLRKNELVPWIQRRVAQEGGSISSPAVNLLTEMVGNDLWTMTNEISKLLSFAAGRRIEEADIRALVTSNQEANIFALVDAITDANGATAQNLLEQLLADGGNPSYVLTMLARQLQMIVRAREFKSQQKSEAEIQERLRIGYSFILRRLLDQVGKYSMVRLIQIYRKLLETDLSIKTGKLKPELALNLLVADLCQSPSGTGRTRS
ncbi:MAG: DNA polymerase III subunit delta [Chloroflexi bacterium]|nr:DNA polymerase III subunit delta [Chloroflexota bacterium]